VRCGEWTEGALSALSPEPPCWPARSTDTAQPATLGPVQDARLELPEQPFSVLWSLVGVATPPESVSAGPVSSRSVYEIHPQDCKRSQPTMPNKGRPTPGPARDARGFNVFP
jgi:hypothetical protein